MGADSRASCQLAIDTSGGYAYCAVRTHGRTVVERRSVGTVSHNEELASIASEALAAAGVSVADLSAVILGSGPGSFTGLRIGYSFGKGLALARRIPILQRCSMQAAALGSHCPDGPVVVLLDARRGDLFVAAFHRHAAAELQQILVPQILPRQEVVPACTRSFPGQSITWLCEAELNWHEPFGAPSELGRGLLAQVKDEDIQQFSLDDVAQAEPQYLRLVAARTIAERSTTKAPEAV
jgi:tRNA threonylcarbamoyl adenosine modification protein YeaZ